MGLGIKVKSIGVLEARNWGCKATTQGLGFTDTTLTKGLGSQDLGGCKFVGTLFWSLYNLEVSM